MGVTSSQVPRSTFGHSCQLGNLTMSDRKVMCWVFKRVNYQEGNLNFDEPKCTSTKSGLYKSFCFSGISRFPHSCFVMTALAQMDYWRASKQLTGCQGYSERIRPIYFRFFKSVSTMQHCFRSNTDDLIKILSVWRKMKSLNVFL